jgi:addiction module HigA family antidote
MRATASKIVRKIGMAPPHPGEFIRDEILDELGLSVSAAAEALGVRRATLSDLVNGNAALSPEMALRVEKAFGMNMEMLLRMQVWHDAVAMRRQANEIDVKPYSAPAPSSLEAMDAAARFAQKSEAELIEARRLAREVIEDRLRKHNVDDVPGSEIMAVVNQLIEDDPSYIEQAKANLAEALAERETLHKRGAPAQRSRRQSDKVSKAAAARLPREERRRTGPKP